MQSKGDVVKSHGWCMVVVTERILVTDERRPVKCTSVYEIGSKTYDNFQSVSQLS